MFCVFRFATRLYKNTILTTFQHLILGKKFGLHKSCTQFGAWVPSFCGSCYRSSYLAVFVCLSIMSDCDNAVYSEVADTGKGFTMSENKCYGDVGYTSRTTKSKSSSCTKVPVFLLLALVIASLLATVGACIALGLEIAKLKSDIATHQESQSALVRRVESAENEILQLNTSFNVSSVNVQQIQGYYLALDDRIQQLNVAIEMLNSSLGSGAHANDPAPSCAALPPSSGYYWVRASNGSAVRVYCDMTRSCGNITGGWVRVAELDMTNSSHQCPSGLTQHNDSNIRTCRRMESSGGCSSVMINIPYSYSRVCGRVIAYQVGTTNAFYQRSDPTLERDYVDGVSLTRGEPRQHVWTFAAGLQEDGSALSSTCPCTTNARATPPPNFVGNDYFCEAGTRVNTLPATIMTYYDPLWDGDDCRSSNPCCSFNNPPWFYKQLPQPTTDDLEMRVCRDEDVSNEDIALESVEIYVQ